MNRDKSGNADETNMGGDSKDKVMHITERSVIFNEKTVGCR